MSSLRYLSSADVAALMPPMKEVVDLVEETLTALGKGEAVNPPKLDLKPGGEAFLHAMPAAAPGTCGMKWVAGVPSNKDRGLPTIHGLVILNDTETGAQKAVMDAGHITAARTGACAAVTARMLADPDAEVITMIGCGVQARAAIEALLCVFPDAERMLAYDADTARQEAFADEVMTTFDLASIIPPEPQEAVNGAQVLVTAIPMLDQPKPFIEPDWLQKGTTCIALDFDAAFTPATFQQVDRFVTDELAQYASYKAKGHFDGAPDPETDLPSILTGKAPGRGDGQPTTLSVNLGLGVLDCALAERILARAEAENRGAVLPL